MGNMSYCRFENTQRDMADCVSAISDEGGVEEYVRSQHPSSHELYAMKQMLAVSQELVDAFEDLDWDDIKSEEDEDE